MNTTLSQEYETFKANRVSLSQLHKGKFVLIKGERIVDVFNNLLDAVDEGNSQFGDSPFLVNEITDKPLILRSFPSIRKVVSK